MRAPTRTLLSSALLLSVVLASGCRTINAAKNAARGQTATAPPAVVQAKPPLRSGSDLSERELCVATARTLADKGHATEAAKLYEKAEAAQPGGPRFDLELAPLYSELGETQKAVDRYRRVIAAGKASADTFNNLAWTLIEAGSPAEALAVAQQGIAIDSTNKRLQATEAIALYKLGRRDDAFDRFQQLYGASAAHHNLAVLDVDTGQIATAVHHAQIAAQSPDSTPVALELHNALQSRLVSKASHLVR